MDLKRVTAEEAKRLVDEEGYVIVDVRSMPEFSEGHPAGAYNIPFLHKTPQGMIPNQDFARIIQFAFPDPSTKIITSCQMGGRSVRAAAELQSLGYHVVADLKGGFGGEKDDAGQTVNAGWQESGLPVDSGEPEGRAYRALNNRANQGEQTDEPPAEGGGAPQMAPQPLLAEDAEGMNRFASRTRTVKCVKLGKELPGLKRRPYPGELGQRIYDEISAAAWDMWVEHSKMIINEYRINSADPNAIKLLMEQCEQFFFGEGVEVPEGYVPQGAAK